MGDIEIIDHVMSDETKELLGTSRMSPEQRAALSEWGMRMFHLGELSRPKHGTIDEIKYEGHLVVFDDGTRFEVDSADTYTADMWSSGDEVVVIDGEMWKLDDSEKVAVTEE